MRALGIIFTLFVIIITGALLAPQFIDWNTYKGQIVSQIEAASGFKVEIGGDIDLAVLPTPRIVVNKFSLSHPDETAPLLTLDHVDVYLDVMPLLSGQVSLKSITLNKPQIALVMRKNGQGNWVTDQLSGGENAQDTSTANETRQSPAVEIGLLKIVDGTMSYEDRTSGTIQNITNLNGTFSMKSLQGPFEMTASFEAMNMALNISGAAQDLNMESKTLSANVKAGVKGAEVSFSGIVGFGEVPDIQGETNISVASISSFLQSVTGGDPNPQLDIPVKAKGILSANATAASYKNMQMSLADIDLNGDISLSDMDKLPESGVISLNLSGDDNAKLKGDIRLKDGSVSAEKLALSYKASDLSGQAAWKAGANAEVRPVLSLNTTSNNLDIDQILSALGQGGNAAKNPSGASDIKSTAAGMSVPFNADIDIKAQKISAQGQVYRDVNMAGRLRGAKLDQLNVSASDPSGLDLSVKGVVGNINALTGLDVNIVAKSNNIRETLNAFGQEAVTSSLPVGLKEIDVRAAITGDTDSLKFDADVEALNGTLSASGVALNVLSNPSYSISAFGVKHPNLAKLLNTISPSEGGENAALAKPVNMSGGINIDGKTYGITGLKGTLGTTNLSGDLVLNMGGSIPNLSGSLSAGKIALEEYMSKSTAPSSGAAASSSGGKWPDTEIDMKWLNSAVIDLKLSATELSYGKWDFRNPSFSLKMRDGIFSVEDWNAGLFGGTSAVNVKMFARNGFNVETDMSLDNVGLQSLVTALAGSPIIQSPRGVVDFQTSLAATGKSMNALINNLSGAGAINGTDITIRGIDVANLSRALSEERGLGRQLEALAKTGIRGGSSNFDTLDGEFKVTNGIVDFSKLYLAGSEADVATLGTVSLPAWTIDMKSAVQLKVEEGIEPPPPVEISYRGSLSNPGSSFAQNALEGYLNKKLSAKANEFIQDKLGNKLDDKLGGELGGVIGGLLGVKPQQQQTPQPAQQDAQTAPANDNNDNNAIQSEELPPNNPSPYVPDSATLQQQQQEQQQSQQEQTPQKIEPEDVIRGVLGGFLQ